MLVRLLLCSARSQCDGFLRCGVGLSCWLDSRCGNPITTYYFPVSNQIMTIPSVLILIYPKNTTEKWFVKRCDVTISSDVREIRRPGKKLSWRPCVRVNLWKSSWTPPTTEVVCPKIRTKRRNSSRYSVSLMTNGNHCNLRFSCEFRSITAN